MKTVLRGESFEAVATGFAPGLAGTIGVRIRDNQGNDVLARTTADIVEDIADSGIYRTNLTAPSTLGDYSVVWDAGEPPFALEDLNVVSASSLNGPGGPGSGTGPGPTLGPCTSWIDGADVAACCALDFKGSTDVYDRVAVEASMMLYELSGRQFTGQCSRTVRPCADRCGCWGPGAGTPWTWSSFPAMGWWGWRNENGQQCGCSPLSTIRLAGYPVTEILEITIDGEVLDPSGYRLDRWRDLVRLDDPGPPVVRNRWPGCQNLALNDDQPGTFSITYLCGVNPPGLGKDAAAELACQLAAQCGGRECALPPGTTRVQRQGVTVDKVALGNWFNASKGKGTGMPMVDAFLAGYWRARAGRRPMVWTPDRQYPRRIV